MRDISERFATSLGISHRAATTITAQPPGGDETALNWSAASVSASLDKGTRWQASLTLPPKPGTDLYEMVSTPGTLFRFMHGIDYGAGDRELVPCGVFEVSRGGANVLDGDVSLSLVDLWSRIEQDRFPEPYSPFEGTRASRIAEVVTAAIPGTLVDIRDDGGSIERGKTWDRDRTQFISDLAKDGELDVGFDAAGVFVIRAEPMIAGQSTVWTFKTGPASNVSAASRERPFDRLYNTVVVVPSGEEQTWTRQTVTIADTSHPRHPSKIGVRNYFYASPTITAAAGAQSAGRTILQRILRTTETASFDVAGNIALEVGDTLDLLHEATASDPGFGATHILDGFSFDLKTDAMTVSTRSAAGVDLEEAA